jgi:hypothetical protein
VRGKDGVVEPEPQSLPSRYSSWAPLQAGWPLPYRCLVDLNSSLVLVLLFYQQTDVSQAPG